MEGLATLARSGGLLALTATFLSDSRFVFRKLTLLYVGARRLHRHDVAESLEAVYRHMDTKYELKELVPDPLPTLEHFPLAAYNLNIFSFVSPLWIAKREPPPQAHA